MNRHCHPDMIYSFNNRKSFYMTASLGLGHSDWPAGPFRFADKNETTSVVIYWRNFVAASP